MSLLLVNTKISLSLQSKKPSILPPRLKIYRISCSKRSAEPISQEEGKEVTPPWDWKVTACVMTPYLMRLTYHMDNVITVLLCSSVMPFIIVANKGFMVRASQLDIAGAVESAGQAGMLRPHSEDMLMQLYSTDEVALRMFADQLLKSVVKLSILYMFVSPHQPFPDGIFTLRWEKPFNPQNGWILWTGGGLVIASAVVFLLKTFISGPGAGQAPNEAESLVRLLPLIGSSNISTVCLLGILGILAPICEETLYRGFFLTSLTKWFPLPVSVAVSSAVFALAHQSPGKFLEIFFFGITLGAIYGRTWNLLIPISMHACWNSGVILLLTYLHNQGYDIQKYIL